MPYENLKRMFENSILSETQMLENLYALKEIYQKLELKAVVVPQLEELPLPALVAVLENDEKNRPRIVTNSFLPMERDDAEHTKFLQFYMELQNDLNGIQQQELLEMLQWVNRHIPMGSCMLREADESRPVRLVIRMTHGFPVIRPIDPGVFAEELILFDQIGEMVSGIFDHMAEGYSAKQIQEELDAEEE